ncbi:hypothetical protein [Flavimaricola marinus]|uniref:Uncharacterized protein n=1 Tax=Flavimaricola marinus TaxID=1819565 RepID=A0A238LG36_9RHOB|nr:hypothetical protein [Flavimaricola marinus]SMY08384.1 hypothetical protein LOM8899_02535 [Flavimaricola marinus]
MRQTAFNFAANADSSAAMNSSRTLADWNVLFGTADADQIIAGPSVKAVLAGRGNDVVIANTPDDRSFFLGGQGRDSYVIGGDGTPGEVFIGFDPMTLANGGGDQIILTDFSADSTVTDLGGGSFQISDTDGDTLIVNTITPGRSQVDADAFADSLVFAQGSLTDLDGTGDLPRIVIADDVGGIRLTDGDGASTFVVDETVQGVDAGGGNDVILIRLGAAPDTGTPFVFSAGDGDDVVELQEEPILDFALTGDENFVIDGGAGNDTLSIDLDVDNLGEMAVDGGAGNDAITVDLRGSTNASITVTGGQGDDTFIFYSAAEPGGPTSDQLDMTTVADEGQDTLIVYTGTTTQSAGGREKCYLDADGTDGALLTLVLPDFGDTVEVYTDADGAVVFVDQSTGATFGCYFCDDNDLTARELLQSDGFATDFDTILIG